jgi:hypothetical protein
MRFAVPQRPNHYASLAAARFHNLAITNIDADMMYLFPSATAIASKILPEYHIAWQKLAPANGFAVVVAPLRLSRRIGVHLRAKRWIDLFDAPIDKPRAVELALLCLA